jgi:N-formylglutamate amidohydrolase
MAERERAAILTELTPAYTIVEPVVQTVPFVFCSPHSGRQYPSPLTRATRLDPLSLRRSEDCYVDELLAGVGALGAPMIAARFPRAYLDVNREAFELDPALFTEPMPDFANTTSLRVVGGLGTIPRIVADGEDIYRESPTLAAAMVRIELLYRPFHAALSDLVERTRRRFGQAVLVDCHSMPSTPAGGEPGGGQRPDFVIGDRFGSSCDGRVTRALRQALGARSANVQLNRPYAGGFITEHYGQPYRGVHAIQLEINRGLYLDEQTLERASGFGALAVGLGDAFARMILDIARDLAPAAAAE